MKSLHYKKKQNKWNKEMVFKNVSLRCIVIAKLKKGLKAVDGVSSSQNKWSKD